MIAKPLKGTLAVGSTVTLLLLALTAVPALGNTLESYTDPSKPWDPDTFIWDLSTDHHLCSMKVTDKYPGKGPLSGCSYQIETGPVHAIPDEDVLTPGNIFTLKFQTADVPRSAYPPPKSQTLGSTVTVLFFCEKGSPYPTTKMLTMKVLSYWDGSEPSITNGQQESPMVTHVSESSTQEPATIHDALGSSVHHRIEAA